MWNLKNKTNEYNKTETGSDIENTLYRSSPKNLKKKKKEIPIMMYKIWYKHILYRKNFFCTGAALGQREENTDKR